MTAMSKTRTRLWRAALMAGALAIGGSAARAGQTLSLTLTDNNKGFSIAIVNDVTTGQASYNITVGSGPSTGTFQLDGQTVNYNSGSLSGSFAVADATTISFNDADFANFSANINVQTNSPDVGGSKAKVFDTSIDTKN